MELALKETIPATLKYSSLLYPVVSKHTAYFSNELYMCWQEVCRPECVVKCVSFGLNDGTSFPEEDL